jgi:hypothetical protein
MAPHKGYITRKNKTAIRHWSKGMLVKDKEICQKTHHSQTAHSPGIQLHKEKKENRTRKEADESSPQ